MPLGEVSASGKSECLATPGPGSRKDLLLVRCKGLSAKGSAQGYWKQHHMCLSVLFHVPHMVQDHLSAALSASAAHSRGSFQERVVVSHA